MKNRLTFFLLGVITLVSMGAITTGPNTGGGGTVDTNLFVMKASGTASNLTVQPDLDQSEDALHVNGNIGFPNSDSGWAIIPSTAAIRLNSGAVSGANFIFSTNGTFTAPIISATDHFTMPDGTYIRGGDADHNIAMFSFGDGFQFHSIDYATGMSVVVGDSRGGLGTFFGVDTAPDRTDFTLVANIDSPSPTNTVSIQAITNGTGEIITFGDFNFQDVQRFVGGISDASSLTLTTNAPAFNAWIINTESAADIRASLSLVSAIGGKGQVTLIVEQGSGVTNKFTASANFNIAATNLSELSALVQPLGRFMFTNESTGSGSAAFQVQGYQRSNR